MEWLSCLQTDGAQSVRVIHVPTDTAQLGEHAISDRMSVGFIGGGGRWLLEVSKRSGCEYWEANWNVGDKDREDKLIWQVSYGRVAANQPRHDSDGPSMHEVHALLASTLEAIRGFAQTHALGGFASSFEAALTALRSEAPLGIAFHSDIAPDGLLSRDAAQLLAASQAAWVFGGMGSWNDLGFGPEHQPTYDRLSDDLYRLCTTAVVLAANSTAEVRSTKSRRPWWKPWS
jgi:hypothetical protein